MNSKQLVDGFEKYTIFSEMDSCTGQLISSHKFNFDRLRIVHIRRDLNIEVHDLAILGFLV